MMIIQTYRPIYVFMFSAVDLTNKDELTTKNKNKFPGKS